MEFILYTLGNLLGNEIVEITLSVAANVCLLDFSNFNRYKNGLSFNYIGGYITSSPCRIRVPYAGNWYVTIDLGGYSGHITHSCEIITPDGSVAEQQSRGLTNIETLRWQIQEDNPDCMVKVTSRWLEKHPKYGNPNVERTDFLVFDKKTGNLHKHFSIGEDTNWELHEWHDWY